MSSKKLCEIRLYSARGLSYTGHVTTGTKGGFSATERAVGKHLVTPSVIPLDVKNDQGHVFGTLRDLGIEEVPYKVRIWVLAEYGPEKL